MVQALENALCPVRPISQRIAERDSGTGRRVALGGQCGDQASRPRSNHQNVGVDQHAVEIGPCHRRYHGRGRFLTDGCTSTMCSGQ